MKKFALVILLSFSCIITVSSQAEGKKKPSTCEEVRHAYDESIASSIKSAEHRIILIFQEGKDETLKRVIYDRMEQVRNHIRFRAGNLNRFVFAKGEKVSELGKLEIYIEGKLTWELYARKNLVLGSDCSAEPF